MQMEALSPKYLPNSQEGEGEVEIMPWMDLNICLFYWQVEMTGSHLIQSRCVWGAVLPCVQRALLFFPPSAHLSQVPFHPQQT